MSGAWHTGPRDAPPRRRRDAARVVLETATHAAAQYGGVTLALRTSSELRTDPRLRLLGPDILAEDFTLEKATAELRRGEAGQSIGEALLDQRRLAGIGNIFKSEACFAAGLDPWRRIETIEAGRLQAVVAAARELMCAAVDSGRRTTRVYRRAGRPCPSCGTAIRSRPQGDANRTTYWCPGCQR